MNHYDLQQLALDSTLSGDPIYDFVQNGRNYPILMPTDYHYEDVLEEDDYDYEA